MDREVRFANFSRLAASAPLSQCFKDATRDAPRTPMHGDSAANVKARVKHELDRVFGVSAVTTPRPTWLT